MLLHTLIGHKSDVTRPFIALAYSVVEWFSTKSGLWILDWIHEQGFVVMQSDTKH